YIPLHEVSLDKLAAIQQLVSLSKHPKSQIIADSFAESNTTKLSNFQEHVGFGISGIYDGLEIKIGSHEFIFGSSKTDQHEAETFVSIDHEVIGYFTFNTVYRNQITTLFKTLKKQFELY